MTYRKYLENEFERRRRRNSGYSLRAFARDLGMPPSKLSEVFRHRCGLSRKNGERLASLMGLSPNEKEHFLCLIELEHGRSELSRQKAAESLAQIGSQFVRYNEINLERFRIISDWWHFAILELTRLNDFEDNPDWIARRLGISPADVQPALNRLLEFGLLVRRKNGKIEETDAHLATPGGVPSEAIREHHFQILQNAENALERVPVELREYSSTTLAISSEKVPEAKALMIEFRRRFSKLLQEGDGKDRVYCLSMQFFPVDIKE